MSNKTFYNEALENLKPSLNDLDQSKIHLIYGSIIEANNLPTFNPLEMTQQWYEEDLNNIKAAPKITNIPKHIDVLILDGGEYSSYAEYLKLKSRCNIIILDDVNCYKNEKVRQELIADTDFAIQSENLNDRNGYSIFSRK